MKRLFTILFAAMMMLSAEAQTQVKVTGNDGSSWTRSNFSSLYFNDSLNAVVYSQRPSATGYPTVMGTGVTLYLSVDGKPSAD